MNRKELLELSDEELLEKANKVKSNAIVNALFIGFCIGIVIYSIAKNSFGIFTIIPLYFIYRMVYTFINDEALNAVLKERNLK